MPEYSYKAKNMAGELFTGTLTVASKQEVNDFLDQQEYFPIEIKEEKEGGDSINFFDRFQKVSNTDIANFTKQVATLIGAGVPIVSALDALHDQTEDEKFKGIIGSLITDVSAGVSFSDSLLKHKSTFSNLYVNMVRAGESAGVLEDVLKRLSDFMEHDESVKKSIKSAMRYPIIVMVALTMAFFFAVTFIIPKFTVMFARSGVELPFITQMLLLMNSIITDYWYMALSVFGLTVYLIRRILGTTRGRLVWDGFKLKLPVFGPLFLKNSISRFAHMLETLNSSGIHIIEALHICSETAGNAAISKEIEQARADVEVGTGLAEALEKGYLFPPMTIRMIKTGQDAGSLDEMLESIFRQYDEEVKYLTERLSAMVEPMMTVIIGVFILIIALGIFLPMWGMYDAVK
ncbi:type II secretion system F family protein [Candidatus Marinimicrobia bacterium MT.SAG.4]|nr:type II secretion system F family protein [Candidatus Marinimicrobia bacterium MT.SAG.4]